MEWQLIETLKPNELVLVTDGGIYMAWKEKDDTISSGYISGVITVTVKINATHWMPLPEPPKDLTNE